jgi:protein-S-isoprenylcysteine O-methyltransferase Ste14
MTPTELAVGTGLMSAAGVYVLVIASLLTDHDWWPPGEKTPAYYCHWSFVGVFNVSLLTTAILSWGNWGLPRGVTLLAGGCLTVLGTTLFLWGAGTLRADETMGVTGELYTSGPYSYTRNPQYTGMIVGVSGFALLADSILVATLAVVHIGWVLLLPRAEEPHLRAEFGHHYEEYSNQVPRFVSLRTVRELYSRL